MTYRCLRCNYSPAPFGFRNIEKDINAHLCRQCRYRLGTKIGVEPREFYRAKNRLWELIYELNEWRKGKDAKLSDD